MKKVSVFLFVVLSAASLCLASTMDDKLMANEKAAWDSFKNKDAKGFSALLTETAWQIDGQARAQDKAQMIQDMANYEMTGADLSDFKVEMLDKDCAVVTYKASLKATYMGKDASGTLYCSTVWVSRKGKWLAHFHQETAMPMMMEKTK